MNRPAQKSYVFVLLAMLAIACSSSGSVVDEGPGPQEPSERIWSCIAESDEPDVLNEIGCREDFDALASEPLDASVPGARTVKVIIDRFDDNAVYFQNSRKFQTHYDYASKFLSGEKLPVVPLLPEFNATEYSSPTRRFLLGSVTYFEGPDLFVYQIAPYDSATSDMIVSAFERIESATYFGSSIRFYASSASVENTVDAVRDRLDVITTNELFAGIDYQPLNVAESFGRLTFVTAEQLETEYVGFRDIVVLDRVPNDIAVVAGIITEEFQTSLSHINVLSRNRGTPNMSLRGAFEKESFRQLEGEWVRMEVTSTTYTIEMATVEQADMWWDANRPEAIQIPGIDETVAGLVDLDTALDTSVGLKESIKLATRSIGGKAAHYATLRGIDDMPTPPGFGVPVSHYQKFMRDNAFDERVEGLLSDDDFLENPNVRDVELKRLRDDMEAAPIDPELLQLVKTKMADDFPGIRMRFRSSTNAEDLDGFTGAGLYTSKSGSLTDSDRLVEDAMRSVWASVWNFRAFEERSYRSIDHLGVAMALLVHRSFPDEEVNGVALTNNPFDPSGLEPAFFINVQRGEVSVVQPPANVTTESILYYFERPNQPVTYLSQSNITGGTKVLTATQLFELGTALQNIQESFAPAYANGAEWWAMDVEFKFDGEPGETPELYVKQARPFQ